MAIVTIVTSPTADGTLVLTGKPSANLVHDVAEAFIDGADLSPLKLRLRRVFGRWRFKRYAIDFTGTVHARVTFSMLTKPEVLHYRRGVIAIAPKSAAAFELRLVVSDVVDPGCLGSGERPYCVS